MIVLAVSSESTVAELIVNPTLAVTSPKVINTKGEIITTAKSQIFILSCLPAQIALSELAANAKITATRMYDHVCTFSIKFNYTTKKKIKGSIVNSATGWARY